MKKILMAIFFILLASTKCFAQCETTIDGHSYCDMEIENFDGITPAPSVSNSGEARIYFDLSSMKLQCSENGGAYTDCVGGGGGGGGDNITVNTTAATNANFLDNIYIDWAINTVATPDDITAKQDYSQTLAGDPTLLVDECIWAKDISGGFILCEGSIADTAEQAYRFPDANGADTTDNFVFNDVTATLTNKTLAAANNVIDADTAVALAANGSNCSAGNAPLGVDASGAVESCTDFEEDLSNSAGLATAISDETGTGVVVFGTSPTITTSLYQDGDVADAGYLRLQNAAIIGWEASPAGTDVTLTVDSSEIFQLSGALTSDGTITSSGTFDVTGATVMILGSADVTGLTITTDGTGNGELTLPADSLGDADIDWGSGAGQVNLADIPGGVAGASVFDLGGATSVEIPNGTGPTVDAAGEIAVDTTDDQLIYYGSAVRVVPYERTVCFVIEDLAAGDDNYAFYMVNDAITVTGVGCNCRGTCSTTATFTLEDRGGNAMTITDTNPTCATTGAATFKAVTAGNQLTAGEMVAFDVTNTPTASDEYALCITYTVDAQ